MLQLKRMFLAKGFSGPNGLAESHGSSLAQVKDLCMTHTRNIDAGLPKGKINMFIQIQHWQVNAVTTGKVLIQD